MTMTRKISLTRIHAINWYGYSDTFSITGNLLIAGITGSGKSALMDLIQLVLIGDRRTKYNASATGKASTRTLKSYCLGDTKEDIDGVPQYMRPDGAITYAALEFTWPDGSRAETWGLRVEFAGAAHQTGDISPFMLPEAVGREFFLDANNCPLDYAAFGLRVKNTAGQIFRRLDDYRETMADPPHLNFDRRVIDHLLPQAMSFTFLASFDEHCRNYILPAELLDVQPLVESYRAFQSYETEIKILADQKAKLITIADVFTRLENTRRDALLYQHLSLEWAWKLAQETALSLATQKSSLEIALATERGRLADLERLQKEGAQSLTALRDSIHQIPGGDLYLHLKERNRILAPEIEMLKTVGKSIAEAAANRARLARQWLSSLKSLDAGLSPSALDTLDKTTRRLAEAEIADAPALVSDIAEQVKEVLCSMEEFGKPFARDVTRLEADIVEIKKAIADLDANRPPERTPVLDALNTHLPKRQNRLPAQALRELCEVADERWRPALEVAFTRKHAIVVDADDYEVAEKIYFEFRGESSRESLIDPRQALALGSRAQPDSLAEKLRPSHPVAAAVVNHLLGDLRCVNRREELRQHARAILPDGFSHQRPFVQRTAHYNGLPVIGRRGLIQQLEFQKTRLQTLLTELAPPKARLGAIQQALNSARSARLDQSQIEGDLAAAKLLPDRQKDLAENIIKLSRIDQRSTLDERQHEITELDQKLTACRDEENRIREGGKQQKLVSLTKEVDAAQQEVITQRGHVDAFIASHDVSPYATRLAEIRAEIEQANLATTLRHDRAHQGWEQNRNDTPVIREKLESARREFGLLWGGKFQHLDPAVSDNASYQALLAKVAATDLPHFGDLATGERQRWHTLFRQQVLEKLNAALKRIEKEIEILSTELRTPIGNNRYRITYARNPDYKIYHELMQLSALHHDDELFFSSVDGALRTELETFLQNLLNRPNDAATQRLLDYRCYYTYDMLVEDLNDPLARPSSVDRHAGKFSGGENQSPYFVAILASYLRAYRRHQQRRNTPSLALVPIDEAFSKLSGERIRDCIDALQALDLQGVFSMSSGNIPYALDLCDWFLFITKRTTRVGSRQKIRNIAVSLARESADAQELVADL